MTLEELQRRHPEWQRWLAALREVLGELDNRAWDEAVPVLGHRSADAPMLASAGWLLEQAPERAVMPLLHACRRRWPVPAGWAKSYCPICGAWPAFAEVCGVERQRFLRCTRCGCAWQAHALSCPFCATNDHGALASLVVEDDAPARAIEVCLECRGYLKVFTRLRPGEPADAVLDDLASIELDLAAQERGYRRPPGAGYGLA